MSNSQGHQITTPLIESLTEIVEHEEAAIEKLMEAHASGDSVGVTMLLDYINNLRSDAASCWQGSDRSVEK